MQQDPERMPVARRAKLARHTRLMLALMAIGLALVFALAAWIEPYDSTGQPRTMATHTQLGLPPCTMAVMTGQPCPSCGMTTSFALLAHGDVVNSLRANWVGTLLAVGWALTLPWALASAVRGRLVGIRNGELALTFSVGAVLALLLLRWAAILFL